MTKDPLKSPFNSPSKVGLHPHVIKSTGQEVNGSAYEFEDNVFAALEQTKGIPEPKKGGKGGIAGFITEHPFLSAMMAIGASVAVAGIFKRDERLSNPDEPEILGPLSPEERQTLVRSGQLPLLSGMRTGELSSTRPPTLVPMTRREAEQVKASLGIASDAPSAVEWGDPEQLPAVLPGMPARTKHTHQANTGNSIIITTEALAQLRGDDIVSLQKKADGKKPVKKKRKVTQERDGAGHFTSKKRPKRKYTRDKKSGKFATNGRRRKS